VAEVVGYVVAAERQHGHGFRLTTPTFRWRQPSSRPHRSRHEHAVVPVEGLKTRGATRADVAEDDRRSGPCGPPSAARCLGTAYATVKREFDERRPPGPRAPCQSMRSAGGFSSFPPTTGTPSKRRRDVGEDRVVADHRHRVDSSHGSSPARRRRSRPRGSLPTGDRRAPVAATRCRHPRCAPCSRGAQGETASPGWFAARRREGGGDSDPPPGSVSSRISMLPSNPGGAPGARDAQREALLPAGRCPVPRADAPDQALSGSGR
jgi:hypothetical protein